MADVPSRSKVHRTSTTFYLHSALYLLNKTMCLRYPISKTIVIKFDFLTSNDAHHIGLQIQCE